MLGVVGLCLLTHFSSAADLVNDPEYISGFELYSNGLFWWSTPGVCSTEIEFRKNARISLMGVLGAFPRNLASDCTSHFQYAVRDNANVYFVNNGRHYSKAVNAGASDPAQLLPTSITAGFQPGAMVLWNGRLYWTQSNGSTFDLWSVNLDGTGQQYFGSGSGSGIKKLSVFKYGPFSNSQTTALCLLTQAGILLRWDIDPAGTPIATLASGVWDFAIRNESRFIPGSPISRFATVYAIHNNQKELLTVNAETLATSVIYPYNEPIGDNELEAVAVDSRNVYLIKQPIVCNPFCSPVGNYNLFRQYRPPSDLDNSRPWIFFGTDSSDSDIAFNLRSDEQMLYWIHARTIKIYPTDAPALDLDIKALGVEIVQTIQNMDNQVKLAANKPTFARGYAHLARNNTGKQTWFPSAALRVSLNGLQLGTLQSLNNTKVDATSDLAVLRADRARSFVFELPANWVQLGNLAAELTVDANHTLPEAAADFNNNRASTPLIQVNKTTSPCLVFIPIHTTGPSYGHDDTYYGFLRILERARSLLPVERLDWFPRFEEIWKPVGNPVEHYEPFDLAIKDEDSRAITWLANYAAFERHAPSGCGDVHWVGTVHPDAQWADDTAGLTLRSIRNCLLVQMNPGPTTPSHQDPPGGFNLAHELAHNYGLHHVKNRGSCGFDDIGAPYEQFPWNPNGPWDTCTLGPNTYSGFDPLSQLIIKADEAGDLMSYANTTWMSHSTWSRLCGAIPGNQTPGSPTGPVLMVQGTLNTALNTTELWPLYQLPEGVIDNQIVMASFAAAGQIPNSPYLIRLLNATGAPLSTVPLVLSALMDGNRHQLGFLQFLPYDPKIRRIQFLRGTEVLAEKSASPNAPDPITITRRIVDEVAQTLDLAWTTADADGDPLLFTIQYTPDNGATWQTIQSGCPYLSFHLNTRVLPGGSQCRIRIIATDGFNTTIGLTETFVLQKHNPEILIDGIKETERVPYGATKSLLGAAFDAEDGSLPADSLLWVLQGPTAITSTGSTISVSELSPGSYAATLGATDSNNQRRAGTRRFSILPLAVPEGTAPLLDGTCSDSAYADGALVRIPLGNGSFACARFVHAGTDLYACFTDLPYASGSSSQVSAGLRVDANASGNPSPQTDDIGFFVDQDGIPFQLIGNGTTMPATLTPLAGFATVITRGSNAWTAEMRISQNLLAEWNHAAGLMISLLGVTSPTDDKNWPVSAVSNQPNTWAPAYFGAPPPPANQPPIANAGPNHAYNVAGSLPVYLDGSLSFDPDGNIIGFNWTQIAGPAVTLSSSSSPFPSFVAPQVNSTTLLRFRLIVNDGSLNSSPAETEVTLVPTVAQNVSLKSGAIANNDGSVTVQLIWPGANGDLVAVQASTDLIHWMNVATNTADFLHVILFHDLQAGLYRQRFYRLANAPTGPVCVDAPAGLVGWWRAEDDGLDATGSNHGTLINGLGFGSGKIGRALTFRSANQNLLVPASASLDLAAASGMTIEAWINPDDAVNEAPVAEWGDGSGFGAHLWVNVTFGGVGGPGALYASARFGDSSYFASPPGIVMPNVWQHVAFSYDKASGIARLYHNGIEVASKNIGPNPPQTAFNLNVGHRVGGASFRGLLDEMALYNRALSPNEIQGIYLAGGTGKCEPVCGPEGIPLTQDFENGSPVNYALSQLVSAPPPSVRSADSGSTGRFLRLINDGVDDNVNAISFNQTAPGLYQTVRAEFDFRLGSPDAPADGFAFMLIPTSVYNTTGPGFVTPTFFEEPNIAGVFAIGFDVYPRTEPRNDVSVHWDGTEYAKVTMADANINLTSGTFHRALVTLRYIDGGALVTVSLVRDINVTPGSVYTPVRDLFVPGLAPFSTRVEFAARSGALNMNIDLDNISVQFLPFCLTPP